MTKQEWLQIVVIIEDIDDLEAGSLKYQAVQIISQIVYRLKVLLRQDWVWEQVCFIVVREKVLSRRSASTTDHMSVQNHAVLCYVCLRIQFPRACQGLLSYRSTTITCLLNLSNNLAHWCQQETNWRNGDEPRLWSCASPHWPKNTVNVCTAWVASISSTPHSVQRQWFLNQHFTSDTCYFALSLRWPCAEWLRQQQPWNPSIILSSPSHQSLQVKNGTPSIWVWKRNHSYLLPHLISHVTPWYLVSRRSIFTSWARSSSQRLRTWKMEVQICASWLMIRSPK